jgi:hypothetical protein
VCGVCMRELVSMWGGLLGCQTHTHARTHSSRLALLSGSSQGIYSPTQCPLSHIRLEMSPLCYVPVPALGGGGLPKPCSERHRLCQALTSGLVQGWGPGYECGEKPGLVLPRGQGGSIYTIRIITNIYHMPTVSQTLHGHHLIFFR